MINRDAILRSTLNLKFLFTCFVVSFLLPNPSVKVTRIKFATPFPTPILDACLTEDRTSRVACETYAKSNIVIVGGEITIPKLKKERKSLTTVLNIDRIVREAIERSVT